MRDERKSKIFEVVSSIFLEISFRNFEVKKAPYQFCRVKSTMASVNLKCIVCNSPLITDEEGRKLYEENSENLPRLLDKMFDSLSKFFDLRSNIEWEYILKFYSQFREVPFCHFCRSEIAQLVILKQHLEPIEHKISKIKSKISTTIIKIVETTSETRCDPVIPSVSGYLQKQESSIITGTIKTENFDSRILESQIGSFRQNIVKRLKPKVVLRNCDNKISQEVDHEKSLHHSARVTLHDDGDDASKIKLEPPSSPLMEAIECNEEDLQNININYFEANHAHQRHHPQIRPTSWQTHSQIRMEAFSTTTTMDPTCKVEQQQQGNMKMEHEEENQSDEESLMTVPMGEEMINDSEDESFLFDDKLEDSDDPLYVPPGVSSGTRTRSRRKIPRQNLPSQKNFDVATESSSASPNKGKAKSDKRQFPCSFCRVSCSTSSNLFRHTMKIHRKSLTDARRLRKNMMKERAELRRKSNQEHRKLQKANKPLSRNHPKPFGLQTSATKLSQVETGETRHTYKNWNYKKTQNGVFVCCTCGSRRGTDGTMIAHLKVRHIMQMSGPDRRKGPKKSKKWFAVEVGDGKFLMYDKWEFTSIGDGQFQCSTCLYTSTRRVVVEHVKRIHCPEMCRFVCHRCNLGFTGRSDLAKHERQHARQRWWQTGCGSYTYDGLYEFDLVDNSYQCGTCGVVMKSLYMMAMHIRDIHAEPHNCRCLDCGMQFRSRGSLRKHRIQACESQKWCTLNDGKFLYDQKWFVETFTVTEGDSEVIRYRCCACGQSRSQRTALRRHINEFHINPGIFVCGICSVAFNKAYDLKIHQSVHTHEKPWVCTLPNKKDPDVTCGATYKTKQILLSHQNKVHPNESPLHMTTEAAVTTTTISSTSHNFGNSRNDNMDDDDDVIIISD